MGDEKSLLKDFQKYPKRISIGFVQAPLNYGAVPESGTGGE